MSMILELIKRAILVVVVVLIVLHLVNVRRARIGSDSLQPADCVSQSASLPS